MDSGLQDSAVGSFDELCTHVTRFLGRPADPFETFWMIVQRPTHGRALAQRIGTELGIAAGIDFLSMSQLRERLETLTHLDGEDFWQVPNLASKIHPLLVLNLDQQWFAPVHRYLHPGGDRPGRAYGTAIRIARLISHYRTVQPALLEAWAAGVLIDPTGSPLDPQMIWQARLFQELISHYPTALSHDDLLLKRLAESSIQQRRIGVFSVTGLEPTDAKIFSTLARHNDVRWWQLQQVHPTAPSPLRPTYGAVELAATESMESCQRSSLAKSDSLLGRVQSEIMTDSSSTLAKAADQSVQIHACHGPDRQVEVLREVLCNLFEDDPTLEPRDVVILCPELDSYAPLVYASFCLPPVDSHPGNQLRVRVSSQHRTVTNPVLTFLDQLLDIIENRATVTDLLAILSNSVVRKRFGFDDELLDHLARLLVETKTSWGVDRNTRARFDVPVPQQGTWVHGTNRLLAGLAYSEISPALGNIAPIGTVTTGDLPLLGALAEFVARVRKTAMEFSQAASQAHWRIRLTNAIALFTEVAAEDDWQLTNAIAALDSLGDDHTVLLSLSDCRVALSELLATPLSRPSFLTGALDVGNLNEFTSLPYRVVCLLGLDERFPPSDPSDGNDLTMSVAVEPRHQRRDLARQDLLTAILSATEKLIIVTKGADPITNKQLDAPIAILDVLSACAVPGQAGSWRPAQGVTPAIVTHHPMQPFSPVNFADQSGIPHSFDNTAAQGANALPRPVSQLPSWQMSFPPVSSSLVQVTELVRFFTDPAAALVATVGLPKAAYRIELETELPIEVDPLRRWKIGDQLVQSMLAGKTSEESRTTVLLSGLLPPGQAGESSLRPSSIDPSGLVAQAESIARRVLAITQASPARTESFAITMDDYTLTGDLRLHGNQLMQHGFGNVQAKHLLHSWIELLCAAASGLSGVDAAIVRSRTRHLRQPSADQAREILHGLLQLRDSGLTNPLPLPAQLSLEVTRTAMGRPYLGWERTSTGIVCTPPERAREKWERLFAQSPAWQIFFANVDELFSPPSLRTDPGFCSNTPRLVALADWVWKPLGDQVVQRSAK